LKNIAGGRESGLSVASALRLVGAAVRLLPSTSAVHYLDAGGISVALAAGLEAVLGGLREMHADAAALQNAADTGFVALHAMPAIPAMPALPASGANAPTPA